MCHGLFPMRTLWRRPTRQKIKIYHFIYEMVHFFGVFSHIDVQIYGVEETSTTQKGLLCVWKGFCPLVSMRRELIHDKGARNYCIPGPFVCLVIP